MNIMNIKTKFLWSVLGILMLIAGCGQNTPLKSGPEVMISSYSYAEMQYGDIPFTIYVFVAKGTTVQKVDIFINNAFFATDEVPAETYYDETNDRDSFRFPSNYWDTTILTDGTYTLKAVASTSNGEMMKETQFKISHFMSDAEVSIAGPGGNSAKAAVDSYSGGAVTKVSDGSVVINGVQMNWDGSQNYYLTPGNGVIPGMNPGENFTITYGIPGGTEFSFSYPIIEPVKNLHTSTDINQWINGQVNTLHMVWENLKYDEISVERQFEIICYDSMMNVLAFNEREIPTTTGDSECYLSRAMIPDNLKYIKIYIKSIYYYTNGQYFTGVYPEKVYKTKIIKYCAPIKNF